jgi:DNA-binding CsgD family transcriptional regulator
MTLVTAVLPLAAPTAPRPAPGVPAERRALVSELVDRAGHPGTRSLLVGEPGIGRTTLLDHVVGEARAHGVTVLYARGETGPARPFSGLLDLLGGITTADLDALPPVQRAAVDVALARRAPDPTLPPTALAAGVTALLARGPVCLAVDDWPLLDPETTELLRHVLQRPGRGWQGPSLLATQRLTAVLSGSRDTIDHDLFLPEDVLPVPSLTVGSLDALVTARTGACRSTAALRELHRLTGGNPLWSTELSHPQLGRPDLEAEELGVPGSVAAMLAVRVRALTPGARHALAVVTALGTATTATVLAVGPDLRTGLAEATDAGVLRCTGRGWEPTHPLLGAAVLESLGAPGRRELHARVALVATSAAERAHHRDLATPPGPAEDVAAAFDAASAGSRACGATDAARDQAQRALGRTRPGSADWLRRTVALAETALATGDLDPVVGPLLALCRTPLPIAVLDRALPVLADALVLRSGPGAAATVVADLAGTLPATPVTEALLDAHRAEDPARPAADRRARAERAVAVLTASGEAPATVHRALGTIVRLGLDRGEGLSRELLDRMTALEATCPPAGVLDGSQVLLATSAVSVDDVATARVQLEQLLARTRAAGETVLADFAAAHLVTVLLLAGDAERAADLLAGLAQRPPWEEVLPPALVRAHGLLALATGDPDALGCPDGSGWTVPALTGMAAARAGDWVAALPLLEQARARAEAAGVRDPGRRLWLDVELGQTLCALGRTAEARETADRLDQVASRGDRPLVRGQERRLRGLVAAAEGDLVDAERLLGESVDVLAGSGFPAEHGRSLLELGRLLRRRRARARARAALEQALETAVRAGDVPLRRRAEQELSTSTRSTGARELTATEQRIADAVAAGASNREIAAAQFISVRTVESHLASVYRKLGVRGRTRLTRLLDHGDAQRVPLPR